MPLTNKLTVYKASAGSGKTFTLVRNYILLLFKHHAKMSPHSAILAVTFTKKATAEMKERILKELNQLANAPENSPYYIDLSQTFSETEIKEISRNLLIRIVQDYGHFAVSTIDSFFQQVVRSFERELRLPANYEISLKEQDVIVEAVHQLLAKKNEKRAEKAIKQIIDKQLAEDKPWDPTQSLIAIAKYLTRENVQNIFRKQFNADELRKQISQYNDKFAKKINELTLLTTISKIIKQINKQYNRLPLSDFKFFLHDIIEGADMPFIYEKIGTRIEHYMIDEFQDTSTMQWENFQPLIKNSFAQGNGNLLVGDVKQSIYRWRDANWHLLHEQLGNDIAAEYLDFRQMTENYRSAKQIVKFNNTLFPLLADVLKQDTVPDAHNITNIYSQQNVHQNSVKEIEGYVQVKKIPSGNVNDYQQMAMECTVNELRDLQARGCKMEDVAIIVRKNDDISLIAQYLIANGFNVCSQEGMLLYSHPVVKFIIAALKICASRSFSKSIEHALIKHLQKGKELNEQDKECILKNMPLYEKVQALIDHFELAQWDNKSPTYLIALQDKIYNFTKKKRGDIESFLTEWQENSDKYFVPSNKDHNAITLITIHKSKGLEWKVVLIPFTTWGYKVTSSKRPLLWCPLPCNDEQFVPIEYESDLSKLNTEDEGIKSLKEVKENEDVEQVIDGLNTTYVAFTRPTQELYIFVQTPATTKNGEMSKAHLTIGKIIANMLSNNQLSFLKNDSDDNFTAGEKCIFDKNTQKQDEEDFLQFYSCPLNERLRLRRHTTEKAVIGAIMHECLAKITTLEEIDKVLEKMVNNGKITSLQLPEIEKKLWKFKELVKDKDWFSSDYTVLCERDILTPQGVIYRPDRILLKEKHAIVIDYKFGTRHSQYNDQVRTYMNLLREMGYSVEGYLLYVENERIEAV